MVVAVEVVMMMMMTELAQEPETFILLRIGMIMSKRGLFPGSSFMQILISFDMWAEIPGGVLTLSPSRAI